MEKKYWKFNVSGWLEKATIPKKTNNFWEDLKRSELNYLLNSTNIYPQVWGYEEVED